MEDVKRSKTIGEFCFAQRFSKSFYYELKRRGLNPDELEILGVKRITVAAEEAWLARVAEHAKSETAQFEAERRRKLATIAGRIAAESPLHVSRRRAGLLGKRLPRRRQ